MVRVRLHYGEDLRMLIRYMATKMADDPDMAFLVLAVVPFEQLARQSADGDGMSKLPRLLRRYGLWLATRPDNLDFVVSLCRVLIKYRYQGAVLEAGPCVPISDLLFRDTPPSSALSASRVPSLSPSQVISSRFAVKSRHLSLCILITYLGRPLKWSPTATSATTS